MSIQWKLAALAVCLVARPVPGAERVTLTGKVADAAGKPVEHATVLVYHAGVKQGYSIYCPSCYADCGKRAITDAAGAFTIGSLDADLRFELLVLHEGYSPSIVARVDPVAGPAPTAVLKQRPPVEDGSRVVRGRLVDSHGNPVRDALVQPRGVWFPGPDGSARAELGNAKGLEEMAASNANGEFELAYDKPATRMALLIEARGLAPKLFKSLPTGAERQTLTLTDGAMIRGRLMDGAKPVAAAEIGLIARKLYITFDPATWGDPYTEVRIGTQADGSFVFPNVPPGVEWYVYAKMDSLVDRGAVVPVECATKQDGEDLNLGDLPIEPGYRLRGKVVLSDGQAVAAGMTILIAADRAWDSQTVALAHDGSFEFRGLAPGGYRISPSVKGYRPYMDRSVPGFPVKVERDLADVSIELAAQKPAPVPRFEAASLKPSQPLAFGSPGAALLTTGGPGTSTPTRFTAHNTLLQFLIFQAYDVKAYQVSATGWLEHMDFQNSEKFDIDATMAPGTTKEQFRAMLRNLLVERFHLQTHREQKEGPIFALVLGKGGPKLKENREPELADPPDPATQPRGDDGFRIMPPGYTGSFMKPPGMDMKVAVKYMRYSMPKLVTALSGLVSRPVVDHTGLAASYDFLLEYSIAPLSTTAESDTGPNIYTALQSQLGLKLVPDKGMIEMLVIDHADRVPVGN